LMYLLDTNTVIYFFKDLEQVAERLLSHPPAANGSIARWPSVIGGIKEKSRRNGWPVQSVELIRSGATCK